MTFKLFGLMVIFFYVTPSLSQKELELLPGAEYTTYDDIKKIAYLSGNVRFKYEGTMMYCDSARYEESIQKVFAYGKVHMNSQDTLNLFCDSLHYSDRTKLATLYGSVRVRDRYYRIDTKELSFHTKKETMTYKKGAVITNMNKNEKLTSENGVYYKKSEVFNVGKNVVFQDDRFHIRTDTMRYKTRTDEINFYGKTRIEQFEDSTIIYCKKGYFNALKNDGIFEGNAEILKPDQHLFGDTLTYNGAQKLAIGVGNVRLIDFKENVEIFCGHAVSDGIQNFKNVTENPIFFSYKDQDTSYLIADTIFIQLDSLDEVSAINAHRNVRYASESYYAICDSLSNNTIEATTKLFGDPILWTENTQMTGDYMEVLQDSSNIREARVEGSALSVSEVEKNLFYNQVVGKNMTGFFTQGKLKLVHVVGNAKTIYFVEEENENDSTTVINRQGMARMLSGELKVALDSGEVTRVTHIGEPDGVLYDMNKIPEKEMKTENFRWEIEQKPKASFAIRRKTIDLFDNQKEKR